MMGWGFGGGLFMHLVGNNHRGIVLLCGGLRSDEGVCGGTVKLMDILKNATQRRINKEEFGRRKDRKLG